MDGKLASALAVGMALVATAGVALSTGSIFPQDAGGAPMEAPVGPAPPAAPAVPPAASPVEPAAPATPTATPTIASPPQAPPEVPSEPRAELPAEQAAPSGDAGQRGAGTAGDSGGALQEFASIQLLSVQPDTWSGNASDFNWSRNWTHGNVSCAASGNVSFATLTCTWPDLDFSRRGLNCTITGGNFTVTWAPGNLTKTWSGGTLSCAWAGGSWEVELDDDSVEAAAEAARTDG